MTKNLRLAADLVLPLDTATQAIGIVAKRRVGKSYTARRCAEQLIKAGQQVVIADPKGDWWGIRFAADGKSPGLPVVILGGEHGDLPLAVESGEVVAKLVVDERVNVLLDLSLFRKREVARFMTDFMEELYRLKSKESNRTPLMFIVDEADAIMPQKPQDGEERMLGAGEDIVRRGGQRGLGCMLITQRTAVLNKNVLTQCEMLVALRTISPQDLKAMQAWIDVHGTDEERKELMASLPSLPRGQAWFWSPGWPTEKGIFQRSEVLRIETFDSGATPKSGERRFEPKNPADVDLGALERAMAATVAKVKADDPAELRKEIAGLKKQLRGVPKTVESAESVEKEVERRVQKRVAVVVTGVMADLRSIRMVVESTNTNAVKVAASSSGLLASLSELRDTYYGMTGANPKEAKGQTTRAPAPRSAPSVSLSPVRDAMTRIDARDRAKHDAPTGDGSVSGVGQRILNTIDALQEMGCTDLDKATVAALVGYHPNAKSYANAMGSLNTGGYVQYLSGGRVTLTSKGQDAAVSQLSISSLGELHALWFDRLGSVAKKILEPLISDYPNEIGADALAMGVGYHPNAKSFANAKGRLRTLGLIDYPKPGYVVATKVLFPEGLA